MATELRVYKPSESLMELAVQIKNVAGFDPGLLPIFERATKINAVSQLLAHPDMADILDKLEGSSAGFSTDLSQKGEKYEPKVRNACVTQALSLGAQLVNKEFGIIKSSMMLQKNYFNRMLDTLGKDGSFTASCKYMMMWWDTENGEISLNGNMAVIPMTVRYKLMNKETGEELAEKEFPRKIQIKTYPTDGPDMWIGKAERRIWQKLLRYLSGIDFGEDGGDEGGSSGQGTATPPIGTMSLSKEIAPKAEKKAEPTAQDAQFKEIVGAKDAPAAPKEATSKTQTKPYAEMNAEEKKAVTQQAHAESLAKTTAPAAAPVTAPAAGMKIGNAQTSLPVQPLVGVPPAGAPAAPTGKPELF